jgi:hypothetical protein
LRIIFCINGGKKNENGRDTTKPIPQPKRQTEIKELPNPTLMAVIATDMHNDIAAAIVTPKKIIWRIFIKSSCSLHLLQVLYLQKLRKISFET